MTYFGDQFFKIRIIKENNNNATKTGRHIVRFAVFWSILGDKQPTLTSVVLMVGQCNEVVWGIPYWQTSPLHIPNDLSMLEGRSLKTAEVCNRCCQFPVTWNTVMCKTTTTLEPRFRVQYVNNYSYSSVVIEKRYDVTKIQICEIMG